MNNLPDYRATNLIDAYEFCDLGPLKGDNVEKYYVDLSDIRKTEDIQRMNALITSSLKSEQPRTILFTGHRGCGKSTELRRIEKKWNNDYLVIYLEVNKNLDINDIEYTDLYLLVIQQVELELRKIGIALDQRIFKNTETFFQEITQETEESVEGSINLEIGAEANFPIPFLAKLWAKLISQIKNSTKQRTIIRKTLDKNISRIKESINLLLKDGIKKLKEKHSTYKGILVIVDNLDRLNPTITNHLFFDYSSQLQELACCIIYTVPISACYSDRNIYNNFPEVNIMPMINVYEFNQQQIDLNHNQNTLKRIISLIEKRVNIDQIFESQELLLDLAKASGGHVRQLMQIMQQSCLTAMGKEQEKISQNNIISAINKEQFNLERIIKSESYPILAEVSLNKKLAINENSPILLYNTVVLEYNGDKRWNYINPLVKGIDDFKQAINKIS